MTSKPTAQRLSVTAGTEIKTAARILDAQENDGSTENDEILVYKINGVWVAETYFQRVYAELAAKQYGKRGATAAMVFNVNDLLNEK